MGATLCEQQYYLDKRQVHQRRCDSIGTRTHGLRCVDLAVARRLALTGPGHLYGGSAFDRGSECQSSLMGRFRPDRTVYASSQTSTWPTRGFFLYSEPF